MNLNISKKLKFIKIDEFNNLIYILKQVNVFMCGRNCHWFVYFAQDP